MMLLDRALLCMVLNSEHGAYYFVDHMDLIDNYLCAGIRLGPYYTKQARKTDHYD